jgi:hypothetical protein
VVNVQKGRKRERKKRREGGKNKAMEGRKKYTYQ